MSDSLFERGKALEDRFFGEKDKQLLDQLKQEIAAKEGMEALAVASGISDETVLRSLVDQNVTAESLTSISLVPLVAVAWADGVMEENERAAILKASEAAGIAEGSASFQLIASWMDSQPGAELLQGWKDYVASMKSSLDEAAFNQIKTTVMGRAREVAEAAGGFLGIGKTSDKESALLDELETCFG